MNYKEVYSPYPIAANSVFNASESQLNQLGGFIATTAGTITIASQGITLLNAQPVAAGQYLPLPMWLPGQGGVTVTLAGGASGTLLA